MDDNLKLVSVILPVYNGADFLHEAIDSILEQSYPRIELIVINDGSDDNGKTEEIALSYRDRIKYVYKENGGVASALNCGIEAAGGEYIARMDADDISLPDRIEKQVAFMERNLYVGVCATQYKILYMDGRLEEGRKCPYDNEKIKASLLFIDPICHPTVMFRKKILDQGWRYDTTMCAEDFDLWTRMIHTVTFASLPETLLVYRISGENVTQKHYMESRYSGADIVRRYICSMFDIDLREYKVEDFFVNGSEFTLQEPIEDYIIRQFSLLSVIEAENRRTHRIDERELARKMNERWKFFLDKYKFQEKFLAENGIQIPVNCLGEESFVEVFKKRIAYDKALGKNIQDCFQDDIENLMELLRKKYMCKTRFIIYGAGIRGKRLLREFLDKKNEGKLLWELVGIVDKKVDNVVLEHQLFKVQKPEDVKKLSFDYIVVPTAIYFEEIKKELIKIGVAEEKILDNIWLDLI